MSCVYNHDITTKLFYIKKHRNLMHQPPITREIFRHNRHVYFFFFWIICLLFSFFDNYLFTFFIHKLTGPPYKSHNKCEFFLVNASIKPYMSVHWNFSPIQQKLHRFQRFSEFRLDRFQNHAEDKNMRKKRARICVSFLSSMCMF